MGMCTVGRIEESFAYSFWDLDAGCGEGEA